MMGRDPGAIVEGVEDSSDDGKNRPSSFEKKAELAGSRAPETLAETQ